MDRPLLAFAVPFLLSAAALGSGATLPRTTSHAAAPAGVTVGTGTAPAASPSGRNPSAGGLPRAGSVAGARRASAASAPASAAPPAAAEHPGSAPSNLESPLFGASADVVNIDPLATCIGCTGAGAASGDSSSYSRSIKVADESIAEGESPTNGYTGGNVVSLPPNPLLMLAIGTWAADNRHDGTSSEGHSYANAAAVTVGDGQVGTLTLLQARSDATRSRTGQSGRASSDGAQAGLAGGLVTLVLLHSDASTKEPGHVYVAQVNDQRLMTSDQLMGGFPVAVPYVGSVSLFHGAPNRGVVGDVADSKSQGAAEIVSTSTGNTSGPRNQTH
jgi:hypothetical protein